MTAEANLHVLNKSKETVSSILLKTCKTCRLRNKNGRCCDNNDNLRSFLYTLQFCCLNVNNSIPMLRVKCCSREFLHMHWKFKFVPVYTYIYIWSLWIVEGINSFHSSKFYKRLTLKVAFFCGTVCMWPPIYTACSVRPDQMQLQRYRRRIVC